MSYRARPALGILTPASSPSVALNLPTISFTLSPAVQQAAATLPPTPTLPAESSPQVARESNVGTYLAIGGGVLAVGLVGFFVLRRRRTA